MSGKRRRSSRASPGSAGKKTTTVARATTVSLEAVQSDDAYSHWSCPICMDVANDPVELDCAHAFCRACVVAHLAGSSECPICRQSGGTPRPVADRAQREKVRVRCSCGARRRLPPRAAPPPPPRRAVRSAPLAGGAYRAGASTPKRRDHCV